MSTLMKLGEHTLLGLEWVGTAAFTVSGVVVAIRKRMDLVGICVCGFLAAFGGGTLRDVLIDRRPFFWAEHESVLIAALLLCISCATLLRPHHLERSERWLHLPDAIGLGVFCATGLHLSWTSGQPPVVAILMGIITGTFGGVLRDMICNEVPRLFSDHRPYAVCALAGGVAYGVLVWLDAPRWLPAAACAFLTTGLRMLTVWRDWKLPSIGFRN
jgi:uncharacterized membrane protein YeiH